MSKGQQCYHAYCKALGYNPANWDEMGDHNRAAWEAVGSLALPEQKKEETIAPKSEDQQ